MHRLDIPKVLYILAFGGSEAGEKVNDPETGTDPYELHLNCGDKLGIYTILNRDGTHTSGLAMPIGRGATSVVYRASQPIATTLIHRAIKVFSPTKDLALKRNLAGQSPGDGAFASEIENMASFSHENLVKIIDAGNYESPERRVAHPYIVMEFVAGQNFSEILSKEHASIFDEMRSRAKADSTYVIDLLRQVCAPLIYLHKRRFFHMDIAPKNIFIEGDLSKPHVVVGDVGVGRTIAAASILTEEQGRSVAFVAGTRDYTPEDLHPYLNKSSIPLSLLTQYVPYWDIYALGVVIQDIISKFGLQPERSLDTIKILGSRMMILGAFDSVDAVDQELLQLLPMQVITANVPELSQQPHGSQIGSLLIPLGPVPYTDRIRRIIDHPAYARLRRIPQLMLVHAVHPGGVHTRFEHAVGTYGLGRRYLVRLLEDPLFRIEFRKPQLEEALLAIILSPIASFPLEHAVFEVLDSPPSEIRREQRLRHILETTQFPEPSAEGSLRSLIKVEFPTVDIDRVIAIIGMERRLNDRHARVITSLIRSTIDVRSVDYLRRDALHTGIPAGQGIDVDQLIANLALIPDPASVGIRQDGIQAAESLTTARYWMFNRVYWSPLNRSLTAMLKYSIYALTVAGTLLPIQFVDSLTFLNEDAVLNELRVHWSTHAGALYRDHSIIDLLQRPRPKPYTVVLEETRGSGFETAIHYLEGIPYRELEELRLVLIERCSRDLRKKLRISDLLIDLPREKRPKLGEDILVLMRDNSIVALRSASQIVNALPGAFQATAQKLRVFASASARDGTSNELLNSTISKHVKDLIRP